MNEIKRTMEWFEAAVPNPTEQNKNVQVGVHLEEVGEMFMALGFTQLAQHLEIDATDMKTGKVTIADALVDRKELLDALCDQIVTAIGVAHMYDLDIVEGLHRVNVSNWSKFVNRKPVFNENGKIAKGPGYFKPDLGGLY